MLILGNLTFSLNQNIVWLGKMLFVVWIFRWNYYLGFGHFFEVQKILENYFTGV